MPGAYHRHQHSAVLSCVPGCGIGRKCCSCRAAASHAVPALWREKQETPACAVYRPGQEPWRHIMRHLAMLVHCKLARHISVQTRDAAVVIN